MHLDLWAPGPGLNTGAVLLTALLLGLLHGITPDEHTWPITFSYAIGSYSTRGGMKAGLAFSAAFTLQRAIASELAALALFSWLRSPAVEMPVYLLVGVAMALAGAFVLRTGRIFHLHGHRAVFHAQDVSDIADPLTTRSALVGHEGEPGISPWLASLHGFLAGWGFGAFALIIYTVLAPQMPNRWLGFAPGLMFGLGTTVTQVLLGAAVGTWMRTRALRPEQVRRVAQKVAGTTLLWGGVVFVVAATAGLLIPHLADVAITTPVEVHNLHHLGLGFLLVIGIVFGVGATTLWRAMRLETRRAASEGLAPISPSTLH